MKNLVLLVLAVFSLGVANAQFISADGVKYRTLTEFKSIKGYGSDTIVGISVQDTTSPMGAAGYAIITNEDTTLMYLNNDTMNIFTSAEAFKFTPALPCCTPDTIPLYNITTQCTTLTNNRWSPVIVDSFGNVSTTVCDTISYLYVDTIAYNYNDGRPYYVYTALLNQTDTLAPVATILENTFTEPLTYIRNSDGIYRITCDSCFTDNKTFIVIGNLGDDAASIYLASYRVQDNSTITIGTFFDFGAVVGPAPIDNVLLNTSIEIRVYK